LAITHTRSIVSTNLSDSHLSVKVLLETEVMKDSQRITDLCQR